MIPGMGDPMIPAGPPPTVTAASGNITFNVGSGQPFSTIQAAVDAAKLFDYLHKYQPTIQAPAASSEQVTLPLLVNCPAGGIVIGNTSTPTSCVVTDLGTAPCFTTDAYSTWTVEGVKVTGTSGGFASGYYSKLYVHDINVGGSGSFNAFNCGNYSSILAGTAASLGTTITVSGTAGNDFIFSRGSVIFDNSSITFSNAISLASLIVLDSTIAFFAFDFSSFTNGSNVTCSSFPVVMTNGAFFETNGSNSTVDGSPLTRFNIPGSANNLGQLIDGTSHLMSDGSPRLTLTTGTANYYVNNVTGSDVTGNGSSGKPYATLNNAWYVLSNNLDLAENQVLNINLAASATPYTLVAANGWIGGQVVQILGAGSGSTTIDNLAFNNGFNLGAQIWVNGVTLTGSGSAHKALEHSAVGLVILGANQAFNSFDIVIGAATTAGVSVEAPGSSVWMFSGTFTNASCTSLFSASNQGILEFINVGQSFSFSGASFAYTQTALVTDGGLIVSVSAAFSGATGSVTGTRFSVQSNGIIDVGGSASFFPGNAAGVWYGGGCYVGLYSTTVAALPSAATAGAGSRNFVTDATATTFHSTVAGSGTNKVPVVSDGTNWLIG